MIGLFVEMVGGGWVKSYLQNRQMSALAVTGVTSQSCLFISSLFSPFYEFFSLFSRISLLAGPSQVGLLCSLGNNGNSEKALCSRENHTFEGGSPVFSMPKCTFLSGPFLSFRPLPFFSPGKCTFWSLAALEYSAGKRARSELANPRNHNFA